MTKTTKIWIGVAVFIFMLLCINIIIAISVTKKLREDNERLRSRITKINTQFAEYIMLEEQDNEEHWYNSGVYIHLTNGLAEVEREFYDEVNDKAIQKPSLYYRYYDTAHYLPGIVILKGDISVDGELNVIKLGR
jgi:hypothetical protein